MQRSYKQKADGYASLRVVIDTAIVVLWSNRCAATSPLIPYQRILYALRDD